MPDLTQAALLCMDGRDEEVLSLPAFADAATDPATLWTRLSVHLRENGFFADAARVARRATAKAPTTGAARGALILALLAQGDAAGALAETQTLLQSGAVGVDALRAAALTAAAVGDSANAARFCLAAEKIAPGDADVDAAKGLILMLAGRPVEAEAALRAALTTRPQSAEALANLATLTASKGDAAAAENAARRAAALKPFLPAPYALLGRLAGGTDPAKAAAALRKAVRIAPLKLDALLDCAEALRRSGKPADAEKTCRAALAVAPAAPAGWVNLGVVYNGSGANDDLAERAYGRALTVAPDAAQAANNLARLRQKAGRIDLAADLLAAAARGRPDDDELRDNLVKALIAAGRPGEAAFPAAEAVEKRPNDVDALLRLGRVLCLLNRFDEAEAAYRQALRQQTAGIDAALQAARSLFEKGRPDRALGYARWCLRLAPRDGRAWSLFAHVLASCVAAGVETPPDAALADETAQAYAQPTVEPSLTARAAAVLVLRSDAMRRLVAATDADDPVETARGALLAGALDPIVADALTTAMLDAAPVCDETLEKALTLLRRTLLDVATRDPAAFPAGWAGFAARLARQCFLNEYIFEETAQEGVAVFNLGRKIGDATQDRRPVDAVDVALYAAYRPLFRHPSADALADAAWSGETLRLIERQIVEPRREAALKAALPQLTAIDDAVSQRVQAQYEENPYPRWRAAALLEAPVPLGRLLRALLPAAHLPPCDRENPAVLIAGCGSGREAVWAATEIAGARVTALDLSRAGLAYGARQAEKLGATNIAFAQADILRLDDLPAEAVFDVVHCVGVLHHTADPAAGLAALTRRLKPGGVMKLGYYSKSARRAVTAARELIDRRRWPDPDTEIYALRRALRALPDDHPAAPCRLSPDFYTVSSCRDLLRHVHELHMTPDEIRDGLERNGLRLLGLHFDAPTVPGLYRARFPDDPAMTRWDNWSALEAEHPDIFAGMYQLWVARDV